MPGFDGTGPNGMGPVTGGGRGSCNPWGGSPRQYTFPRTGTYGFRELTPMFIYNKIWLFFQKILDNGVVFFGFHAAYRIYQNAAGFNRSRQVWQDLFLNLGPTLKASGR